MLQLFQKFLQIIYNLNKNSENETSSYKIFFQLL